jgi:hypothetical protein
VERGDGEMGTVLREYCVVEWTRERENTKVILGQKDMYLVVCRVMLVLVLLLVIGDSAQGNRIRFCSGGPNRSFLSLLSYSACWLLVRLPLNKEACVRGSIDADNIVTKCVLA